MDCSPLTIAAASRPFPGETVNGDAWVLHRFGSVFRLSVIDGLGHGPDAAAATQSALNCLDGIVDPEPAVAIQACHQVLHSTRGAVMLTASIDIVANRLRYAGVGNVEARLQLIDGEHRLVSYRGIVGVVLPTIRTFDYSLTPHWRLLAHTDGIRGRFDLATEIDGETIDSEWAQRFLGRWARPTDDATVVVVTAQSTQE
jgi:hypothetical protein